MRTQKQLEVPSLPPPYLLKGQKMRPRPHTSRCQGCFPTKGYLAICVPSTSKEGPLGSTMSCRGLQCPTTRCLPASDGLRPCSHHSCIGLLLLVKNFSLRPVLSTCCMGGKPGKARAKLLPLCPRSTQFKVVPHQCVQCQPPRTSPLKASGSCSPKAQLASLGCRRG